MKEKDIKELIKETLEIRKKAYAPYSKFKVGAIVIDNNDNKHYGVNVENKSYGLTVCAERNAIFSGVTKGLKMIKVICLVSDKVKMIAPCGACREVISEFSNEDTLIILADHQLNYNIYNIDELLPVKFSL